ncbi:MAG TPA: purine-nucleoside phosphorylase [Gemmatimonadaceae bacterium]|nr:purine-nucleoside phosphorylase [Gemmatimonadaceae bacterium]
MISAAPAPQPRVAAEWLRARLGTRSPEMAIILGSGLGAAAESLDARVSIPAADVPGFPPPGVPGHAGQVLGGVLEGRRVIVFAGRAHLYEGHPDAATALPVRVAHALGARVLLVANAAGAIRRTFRPGDLMLIRDQINLMWRNPLVGPVAPGELRFPDMSDPYDRELLAQLRAAALAVGVRVAEGVYAGGLGPSYETPAEVRMLEWLGADAVGMSTVPEVLAARALGMRVAGISCITNHAAGIAAAPLDHAQVLAVTSAVQPRFVALVREFVRRRARSPGAVR